MATLKSMFAWQKGLSFWLSTLLVFTMACGGNGGGDGEEPSIPSDNNRLVELTVSEGELSPAFSVTGTQYTVDVENSVESIQVTATLESDVASLTINGSSATSGVASSPISLAVGETPINVVVTAENGNTRTTIVTVNRAEPPLSDINTLSNLIASKGTLSPSFNSNVTAYTIDVENSVEFIQLTATLASDLARLTINGSSATSGVTSSPISLAVGETPINVVVTAENGDIRTTIVSVNRAEAPLSVALTSLTLSGIQFTPVFDSETIQYTATVSGNVDSTVMTAVAEDANATLFYGAEGPIASGTPSTPIDLAVGQNELSVEVHSADDQNIRAYYVTVTREAPLGNVATLDGLDISEGTLSPSFSGQVFNYTVDVAFPVQSITVTPELDDVNATMTVNGESLTNAQTSSPINLVEGDNTIDIVVTAEDGVSVETYQIVVTRGAGVSFAQEAYIKASNTGISDTFGQAIALDGNTIAVGAYREASSSPGINGDQTNNDMSSAGAVYVFVRENETWVQQAYIKASNPDPSDLFGYDLSLSGDTLVVGASREDSNATGINGDQVNNDATDSGAAYVYVRNAGVWTQEAYLKASNTDSDDFFGISVAIDNDTIVVGAHEEDSNSVGIDGDDSNNATLDSGAVYIFVRTGNTWSQQAYLKASNTGFFAKFGFAVAIEGDLLAVGAIGEGSNSTGINGDQSDLSARDSGAVYVFSRVANSWSQEAYVKASNTEADDNFGWLLDLSNNTMVVTATGEDSSSVGVDGDQNDNGAANAGAVYAFTRENGNWVQQAYIKGSKTVSGDYFGDSIALDADRLVIGARYEDSGGAGVMIEPPTEQLFNAGAVFVFERSQGQWDQVAFVKPSNADSQDLFGLGLALNNEFMVVGATREASSATGINGDQSDNSLSYAGAGYIFTIGTVTDVSTNATLSNLRLSEGSLTPIFDSQTTSYTAEVANSQTEVQVLAISTSPNASITVNSVATNSGELSDPIALAEGDNTINVEVLAEDGVTTQTYVITVTRLAEASNDATLSDLVLSAGTLTPDFDAATLNYTADVSFATSAISITPTATHSFASITVNGVATNSGEASASIDLNEGANTITIDVLAEDNSSSQTYEVVVTRDSAAQFAQQAYIKASNTGSDDRFGYSTDISGNTLVVGAPYESSGSTGVNSDETDNSADDAGAAYVFVRDGNGDWSQQAYLKASNTDAGDRFGIDVTIDGDIIVVGADSERGNAIDGESDNSTSFAGAAYVFTRSGTTWTQEAYLKPSVQFSFFYFGASLDLDGEKLAVGSTAGRVEIYNRNGGNWTTEAVVLADNYDINDRFGASVDLDGDTLAVGAYFEDGSATSVNGAVDDAAADAGAAYIFTFANGFWTQQAYLKANNAEASDLFGFSIALDGDLCVVGATQESSNSTGIDGDVSDNSANQSGAVYVFERSGTTWSQQSYIKASNTDASDQFGTSVSLDGNRLAVGAQWEASIATEANGDESDNSLFQAGAVYLFDSSGIGDWSQSAYIKASNTNGGDYFGRSVTLSGTDLIVGADVEDGAATGINGDQNSNAALNAGAVYVIESE